jgi:hippurate hydrolase
MNLTKRACVFVVLALAAGALSAENPVVPPSSLREQVRSLVNQEYPRLFELYKHLHTHPELSLHEEKTGQRVADELKQAGLEVTTRVGGYGVVGVLRNGVGPTILIRTDLDALPVKEQTGLPYASSVRTMDDKGNEVDVMHACGHDVHMSVFVGTARLMVALKDRWQGTLVFIGQPAEEKGSGARAMLKDGLFTRFPKPDYCLALHDKADLAAGTVGWVEGYALANVDSVDITIRGVGGHGAWPHKTKDPIVLAAETVLALQTIVSREIPPGEPAVVTVGSIHGGTKHNIISDEVKLQLTLRSYTDEVRAQTIAAIKRITHGLAEAAGVPADRMPIVTLLDQEFTPATFNDPALTRRLAAAFRNWLGEANVRPAKPVMGGEDFSEYGRTTDKIPICMFWLGAVKPELIAESERTGKSLPTLHSSEFAPLPEPTIKTGVAAMTAAVLELAGKK